MDKLEYNGWWFNAKLFQSEYFDEDSDPLYDHTSKHASINYLDRTQYWTFEKLSGSRGVYLTLGWRDVDCGIASINDPDICSWGGTQWNNMGNDSPTGNTVTGTATTPKTTSDYGAYAWGNFSGINAQAGPDRVMETGDTVAIGIMEQAAWDYAWTPSGTVEESDSAITRAYPTATTEYVLEVTGENSCTATDTAVVYLIIVPDDTAATSDSHLYIENRGQLVNMNKTDVPDVLFYNNQESPSIYLRESAWSLVLSDWNPDTSYVQRVDISPISANLRTGIPMDTTAEVFNYFHPHCPTGITGVKGYSYVVYPEIYDGIDLFFLSNQFWYKLYFVVKPEVDPENIALLFSGMDTITTTVSNSALVINTLAGAVIQPTFDAYTMDSVGTMTHLSWKPSYTISLSGDTIGLSNFGSYDNAKNLVLELDVDVTLPAAPANFNNVWSTYFGTSGVEEMGKDIETDEDGNLYVVGGFSTGELPAVVGTTPVQTGFASSYFIGEYGVRDAVICKFSWDGVRLISTYYGGFFDDWGTDIEIDEANNRLIMFGTSISDDYPTTSGAYQEAQQSEAVPDRVLTSFSLSLNHVFWSTYFGGAEQDDGPYVGGKQLTLDDNSDIYVTTQTLSNGSGDFSTIPLGGAYNQGWTNNTTSILAQFDKDNGMPLWVTYFPASINSIIYAEDRLYIAGAVFIDPDPVICGTPSSGGFPLCDIGGFYQDYRSIPGYEGFLTMFSTDDNAIDWSTYIGGVRLHDIDVRGRTLYAVGTSISDGDPSSSTSPCTEPSVGYCLACEGTEFNLTNEGNGDMFLGSFEILGYTLNWGTLYGGTGNDLATHVEIDNGGKIFVGGTSNNSSFSTVNYGNNFYFDGTCSDNSGALNADPDPVILMLDGSQVLWSTFYGGGNEASVLPGGWETESIFGMTTHEDSRLYITGITPSTGQFPYRCGDVPNQYCRYTFQPSELQDGFITLFRTDGNNTLPVQELASFNDAESSCIIYPNPSNDNINLALDLDKSSDLKIRITDVTGRTVESKTINNAVGKFTLEMDVLRLKTGVYAMEITSDRNHRWTCKFIKQ